VQTELLLALEALRPGIRANWENLLRIERINSPLANPDTLVHLLDTTLDEIFRDLHVWSPRRHPARAHEPVCPCGRNPLLAYFSSGRQALREALIVVESANHEHLVSQRDQAMESLDQVFDHIARREIESFCAICQFRSAVVTAATAARQHAHA